jgi:2-oxoglutarate ferredoxin oxidoreductase subunit alpha
VTDAFALDNFIRKLSAKITKHRDEIIRVIDRTDDTDIAIISYGSVYRAARAASAFAREEGMRVGTFRPVTLWPFPDKEVAEMSNRVKAILVMENNLGQLVPFVKAESSCPVYFLAPDILGTLPEINSIIARLKEIHKAVI